MDIHISNLHPKTNHKTLKQHLRKKLATFGIHSFECNKPKDKPFAFITVPDAKRGEAFLAAHQKQGQLFLVNRLIVKRGNKVPDARHIEGLQKRARDVVARLPDSVRSQKIPIIATSCGVCTYEGESLVYRPEWEDRRRGMLVLGMRALTITTPLYSSQSVEQSTLFKITYSSVELLITDGRAHSPSLTIILNMSPKAYHLPKAAADIYDILSNLTLNGDIGKAMRVRGADDAQELIFANCWVYRVEFQQADWQLVRSFLQTKASYVPSKMEWPLRKVTGKRPFRQEKDAFLNALAASNLAFSIKFQIQSLVDNSYLLPAVTQSLIPVIARIAHRYDEDQIVHGLKKFARGILYAIPVTAAKDLSIDGLTKALEDALDHIQDNPPTQMSLAKKHDHLYMIHRVDVTPAGIYTTGPELEPVNRVLREYSDVAHTHFLRVDFRDDDGESIRFDRNASLEQIHDHWFKRVLTQGIYIAGQTFSFLGFSNSSLKDQSCWFMAPFKHKGRYLDAWEVIKGLGDFLTRIKETAKCSARIGQAFSDTPGGAVDTSTADVVQIRDVERNGYVFSDGCGTISPNLLRKVWATYGRNTRPNLFQIRWGGAKGMISLDERLPGQTLCLRPSMMKFSSHHNKLEICNAARRPLPFYLNRQLVKILEDLGVRADAFHALQDKAIAGLRAAASSPTKAASFLERKDIGKGCNLPWLMEKLHEIGIDVRDDLFLQWALEHATLAELRLMKHKTRIPVENGYTLFGVMDETGYLRENEIFVRVDGKVKAGTVAITRSPALHPGDIQSAIAVPSAPQGSPLGALNNCVVFSQRGSRDLPSKLSGGDLDGDIFNVIFDASLSPLIICEPAEYKRPAPIALYREVGRDDIIKWFLTFMKNDQLARIATLHVQLADRHPEGTLHPECITLAELHSTAVDYQKTGVEVSMSKIPKYRNYKPHFMAPDPRLLREMDQPLGFEDDEFIESDDEEGADAAMNPDSGKVRSLYYHSDKILGQLYDKIDERSFLREIDSLLPTAQGYIAMKRLWAHIQRRAIGIQWAHMKDFAWGIREEYEELVADFMIQYGYSPREPLTEIEVFMGSIIGKAGALPSRRIRESASKMKDHFNESLQYMIRRIVHGNIDSMSEVEFATVEDWFDTSTARDQALERSMACLAVALEPGTPQPGLGKGVKTLKSFQYVAGMVALRELTVFERRNATSIHGLPILSL